MKKITIKLLSLMLVITLFFTIVGCSFLGLTVDEAKANLEDAGYTVTVMDGADYIDSEENQFTMLVSSELDKYLYAEKGDDKIYMYFFYTTDNASQNYNFMNMSGMRSGQNNKVVYFGTKQAVKDSKI